jgi:hypothetical protein
VLLLAGEYDVGLPPRNAAEYAGLHERLQLGREWAFVRQDPRAGLHDVEIRQLLPRGPRIGSAVRATGGR